MNQLMSQMAKDVARMNKHNQLYTYFGCKKKLIEEVWSNYFFDIDMLIEPFAGTAVIACNKPDTVAVKNMYLNDYDCHIANVLRSVIYNKDKLVEYICHPRLELDMHMIHDYLTGSKPYLRELLMKNIESHDVKLAGWWVWGINHWLGGSWCNCDLKSVDALTNKYDEDFFTYGWVTEEAVSTRRRKFNMADQITHNKTSDRHAFVNDLVTRIYDQLSNAKILYGDFERVLTNSYLMVGKKIGIFLDPPYQFGIGDEEALYGSSTICEDVAVFDRALKWFLDNYKNPKYKIILCGHMDSFKGIPKDIKKVSWKRSAGYANNDDSSYTEMFIHNCKEHK